jgi:hypothetical protein
MRQKFRMPKTLPFTIGFEFTGIPIDWKDGSPGFSFDKWVPVLKEVRKALAIAENRNKGTKAALWDDCVEVTTYPTRLMRTVKQAYEATSRAFKQCGLRPKHPDTVCGGGHIHIGGISSAVKYNMLTDMLRRPYLPWAFSEPDEVDACDYPVASIYSFVKAPNRAPYHMRDEYGTLRYAGWYKAFMFRLDAAYDTAEFRFFEAPLNWEEQLLHIQFVVAYYEWIKKKKVKGFNPKEGYTARKLQKISYKQARLMFRGFLRELGLDPADYEHFVQRNMKPRWQNGRTRR